MSTKSFVCEHEVACSAHLLLTTATWKQGIAGEPVGVTRLGKVVSH